MSYKIACGPNIDDYNWTEQLMKIAGNFMDGLSLHYYTVPDDWNKKGKACEFDEEGFYRTLRKTLYMDTLLNQHTAIMDQYDKEKRIGLIVDEWGTWYDVEEGTNPGFLYQQNTMRDALVAAINLNLFNKHCDRVKMANIAQMVNVLQAIILTEGQNMVLTPTYHVFDLYKEHQGGELVESSLEVKEIGTDTEKVPNLTESVSIKDDKVTITIGNLSIHEAYGIQTVLTEFTYDKVTAFILKGDMKAYNDFTNKDAVMIENFTGFEQVAKDLHFTIPPCSVIQITLE